VRGAARARRRSGRDRGGRRGRLRPARRRAGRARRASGLRAARFPARLPRRLRRLGAPARIEILRTRHAPGRERQPEEEDAEDPHAPHTESLAREGREAERPCYPPRPRSEETMTFFQTPPEIGNQFTDDAVLRAYLDRVLPDDVRAAVTPSMLEL